MFDRLKSLLRPPEQKLSRTARLIALEGGGRARWTPRDYAALAREGYTRNAIVHRAVRLIAESIGGLSFVLYEGANELTAHPLRGARSVVTSFYGFMVLPRSSCAGAACHVKRFRMVP